MQLVLSVHARATLA